MQEINISDFKARCLSILDAIARTGERITILKRGKPVAQIVPYTEGAEEVPQQSLAGTVEVHGDIIAPAVPSSDWEAEGPGE